MKAADFNPSALETLRSRIQSADVLAAFERLVAYGIECPHLRCGPGGKTQVRDFRYTSISPRGWPFAFTVSRAHLLFHIRPLGVRTLHLTRTVLSRRIEVVRKRSESELQVVIRNRREADALVEHLLSRWPGNPASTESQALADARNGYGPFRAGVEQIDGACRVTGV